MIEQLRSVKQQLRNELAQRVLTTTELSSSGDLVQRLKAIATDAKPSKTFPSSILEFWQRALGNPVSEEEFTQERQRRVVHNQTQLKLMADFAQDAVVSAWRWEGMGMQLGLVGDGS